jgi:chromate reductase
MFEESDDSMKSLLLISGSASEDSSNARLLRLLTEHFHGKYSMEVMEGLWELPLYTPKTEDNGIPDVVQRLREKVSRADAVVISTPEYLHNIPAVLKNALEWMTTSGNLAEKPVLAITLTPMEPRGEHAMRSLIPSLKASHARVVTELSFHLESLRNDDGNMILNDEHHLLLQAALDLL